MNPNPQNVNLEKSVVSPAPCGINLKPNLPPEQYDLFANFCVGRLPDSFRSRKIVLLCLLKALPKQHPRRPLVSELLQLLRAHENARNEFGFPPRPGPETDRRRRTEARNCL